MKVSVKVSAKVSVKCHFMTVKVSHGVSDVT